MASTSKTRRTLLAGVAGLMGSAAIKGNAATAALTPRAAEGPFYPQPEMRRSDIDNDLVRITGRVEDAGGEIFLLRGTITDPDGLPRAEHRVEIWQCDVDGNYMHPRDQGSADFDVAFQGFGHDITDETGAYVFRTIKPTIYPGRAPHIHVKVLQDGQELLTTQFYISGHPANAGDGLFLRMSEAEASAVSMEFVQGESGPEATVDICI